MIPEGYEILEYLNGSLVDHRLDLALEHLRGLNVKHFSRLDVRIIMLCDEDSSRLLLIGKKLS